MENYFYCYSRPLKIFFNNNGEKEILFALHPKTQKKYWLFIGNEHLNHLIDEWRRNK